MTEEQIALARRAVACKGWRWMPGMEFDLHGAGHLSGGWRIQSVQMRALDKWSTPVRTITAGPCEFIIAPRGGIHVRYVDQVGHSMSLNPLAATLLPFLEDPATLGCLLALVREAHGKPLAFAFSEDEGMWEIGVVRRYYDHFVDTLRTGGSWGYTEGQAEVVYEPSEAHVLVRALEVADALNATKETP